MPTSVTDVTAEQVLRAVESLQESARADSENAPLLKPSHRVPFHWPPHPVSADYHVLSTDWTGHAELTVGNEVFPVRLARTPHGVFGRIERLWAEARGNTEQEALANLASACKPLLARQALIARCLGLGNRYDGRIQDLSPIGLVLLLYCPDRDIAHDAQIQIETHASLNIFGPALVQILRDKWHPHRRSAQWAVLDMFEDLPSFFSEERPAAEAIDAIRLLLWDAPDDYARTIYKAGVVLGGHVCTEAAADALIACFGAPSKIGRRSAIHACFHLVEWLPGRKDEVLEGLNQVSAADPEPLLRAFAAAIARDIQAGELEHAMEPIFPDEQ